MVSREKLDYKPIPLPDRMDFAPDRSRAGASAFLATMKRRHTVRDFSDTPVDEAIIRDCVAVAGLAPSGANHQPWHFVAVRDPAIKAKIREAAEAEEREFYAGGGGDEWISALEPIGTGPDKPHLDIAPWLVVVFGQRWREHDDGARYKNYYVPESVGIATGFLIAALHHAGLYCLTHTPNPMRFLNGLLNRPASEKPVMILAVGHASADATVPKVAKIKKALDEILTVC